VPHGISFQSSCKAAIFSTNSTNSIHILYKQLSYRRETALQGGLDLAKSGRLERGYNIRQTL